MPQWWHDALSKAILREHLVKLTQAQSFLPGAPLPATLKEWAKKGRRSGRGRLVFLETVRIGNVLFTSVEAYERFINEMNEEDDA